MAGIIQAAQGAQQVATPVSPSSVSQSPVSSSAPSSNIRDPLLNKTKMGIEAKVSPQIKKQFMSIEMAAIAFINQGDMTQKILQKIRSGTDLISVVSDGVANIIAVIFNEVISKIPDANKKQFGTTFTMAAPTASLAVMCQVLDMAEQALGTKITPDILAKCSQLTTGKVLAKFKISPEQVQQVIDAGKKQQGA